MPDDHTSSSSRTVHGRVILAVIVACLVVNLWAVTRGWGASLRDAFETRQAQTALTARSFIQDGFRLDYETPLLGPPWSIPMEFPLYQVTTAGIAKTTGLRLEKSARLAGILFFYATLPAVWLLLRPRLAAWQDQLIVVGCILVCPTFLFYTRTVMIESTALCLTVWFLAAFDATLRQASALRVLLAWGAGGLGICAKVTTFAGAWVALGAILAGYILANRRNGLTWGNAVRGPLLRAALALAVPLALGAAWVLYSDHLKELNPYGRHLTSSALRGFNFGTLEQRFSGTWWRQIYEATQRILHPAALLALFAALWFVPRVHRRVALACLLAFPGGLVLFANLYAVHDYYFYASAGFLVVAFGVTIAGLLHLPRFLAPLTLLILGVGLVLQAKTYRQTYYRYFFEEHPAPPAPLEAGVIRALTPEGGVTAGFGLDWNGIYPYYAQRRGVMPFESETANFPLLEESLAGLGDVRLGTVFVAGRFRKEYPFIENLRTKLDLTSEPIVQTDDVDIYVPRESARTAAKILWSRADLGAIRPNLTLDEIGLSTDQVHLFRGADFPSLVPTPRFSKGPRGLGQFELDGHVVVTTHAPAEIHFQPPPGSHSIEAITGLLPGSYTNGHTTAGITVMIFEEIPGGRRKFLYERTLQPLTRVSDRGDIAISYTQSEPFTGTLVFAHYGAFDAKVDFSWGYWRSIVIR